MIPTSNFPRITPANHRVTSLPTGEYNCVAWAAEDTQHWWQPGTFWMPPGWPDDDCGLGALEAAFRSIGYEDCGLNASLEPSYRKVALYGYGFV